MFDARRILYLDLETSGLDPDRNGIWQIGGIIEVDGVVTDEFNFKFSPREDEIVDEGALNVSPFSTEAEMRALTHSSATAFSEFKRILLKHIDKYDKAQKYTLYGYNVGFDDGFLRSWFLKNGEGYYGSYITPYKIDVYTLVAMMWAEGRLELPNLRLETVATHLGIEIKAHDAMSDISATRIIGKIITDKCLKTPGTLLDWAKESKLVESS